MKKWRKPFKRAMAIALAAMMIGNTMDMPALTVKAAEQTIWTEEEGITITGFAELEDAVKNQQLAIGASKEDAVFPDTLTVTVSVSDAEKEIETAEAETEETETESAQTENRTLTGITWELKPSESEGEVFDSSEESVGRCYVYTPVLPEKDAEGNTVVLGADVEIPAIYVLIGAYPVSMLSETGTTCGAFTIRGGESGTDYAYQDGVLQIRTATALTISNTDSSASAGDCIEVVSKAGANITLAGVKIDVSAQSLKAALLLETSGKVTITLADETENVLKSGWSSAGLQVTSGKTLLITGNGSLDAAGGSFGAGIGGGDAGAGGEITIEGGTVTATGGNNGVGIGGGYKGAGGTITIKGGTVTAIGKGSGAGIGGGDAGAGGTVTISGGTVTATSDYGAGIGGGSKGAGGMITIKGGTVTATSSFNGAGIGGGDSEAGGTIIIEGGKVTATGGSNGAGIGGGYNGAGGEITIEGGTVIATGGSDGAGIGGGSNGAGGKITIERGEVTADGGSSGAGIGGGFKGAGGTVIIKGGTVTANGNSLGAGIGGGNQGAGGTVTISGGTVTATGGSSGAGIGGGVQKAGGTVTISGGTVTATSGNNGAGIGGGKNGAGGTVIISGGTVTATSGNNGAGIGGGNAGAGGTVIISGGNLKATGDSDDGAMAIGHGASSSESGTVESGTVMDLSGKELSLYTISLCSLTEAAEVSSLSGINYSVKDMKTLDTNKLYLYLPAEAKLESISLGDEKYRGKFEEEVTFHHDNDTDGICDNEECKEKIANIICVTSMQTGAEGTVANISMNPADGYVKTGESVTVTAPDMLYYQFQGWYLASDIASETHTIVEGADAQSKSFSYTFAPSVDTSLVAVYKAAGEVTVKLSGSGYTVTVNDGIPSATQNSDYTHNFKIGSKVTINAEGEDFLNWKNENGLIVTTQKSYTFTVTGKVTLTMSKKGIANESAMVEFVSDYHQVISGATYGAAETINFPDGPSKMGYIFTGWSLTEEEIQNKISAGDTYIQVTPVYKRDESKKYTVTVYVNGEKDESQSVAEVLAGSTKTVKAPEVEGKVFLYWTDETNKILGYDSSYFMQVNKDIKIYAVYGDEAVEQKPVIVMTGVSASNVNGKDKLSFTVTRDIPDGYELVEHGMLYHTSGTITKPDENTFILGGEGIKKYVSSDTSMSGVFTLNINTTNYLERKVIVRGYMVLKDSKGKENIYYTDIAHKTYNEIKGEN